MEVCRSMLVLGLVSLFFACSSASPFPTGPGAGSSGSGSGAKGCGSTPADLCVVLPAEELNRLCKASSEQPAGKPEPFSVSSPGYSAIQCFYKNEPSNAAEPLVKVSRECFGDGIANWPPDNDPGTELEPNSTERVSGIGDDAYYGFSDESIAEPQNLVARHGNVAFRAEIQGATGTKDDLKACLAAVVKKLIATAPGK